MGSNAQSRRVGQLGEMSLSEVAQTDAGSSYLWGRFSAFALLVAVFTCAADQALKFWLLLAVHLGDATTIVLGPFFDIVLTWNTGISYGLFPQQSAAGVWGLFAFKVVAVGFLWAWLTRAQTRLTAAALGLIIGGAVGNAIDRLHWPGVMDFVLFHIDTASFTFRWYVFNLADVAIVAGVVGLLYESLGGRGAVKAP
jgi:signal peptidase II